MSLAVQLATPADDSAIRALLRRQPMPGRIRISYEREPEFRRGCEVTGEDCRVLVARSGDNGDVVGLACRSTREVFVNGSPQRIGYLGQLRVSPAYRGKWLVSRGFEQLRQLHDLDPVPGYLASIVDANDEATGVLVERRRKNFPVFRRIADYRTLAIGIGRAVRSLNHSICLEMPRKEDLADIAGFLKENGAARQLSTVWTKERLERVAAFGLSLQDLRIARLNGQLVGIAGLWDQSAYKQSVIRGYSGWLRAVAPLYNLSAPLFRRASLPRPGEALRSAYVSLISVAQDDLTVFRALLGELHALARSRGLLYMVVGLDTRDPLLPAALEYSHIDYPSHLYVAEWPSSACLFEQLDGRPTYVDIATL